MSSAISDYQAQLDAWQEKICRESEQLKI